MPLSLDKPKLDNLANEIWKSAERLRGKFKAYEYQNVILPIIVIRRLECVLLKWRADMQAEIQAKQPKRTEKEVAKLVKGIELGGSKIPFSNKTDWTLRKVYQEDHTLLEDNFRKYINGFSKNVDDIIEHFNYRATIAQMVKNNRLAPILNQYKELPVGPEQLSNLEMGYVYEELLRRFSEQSGEEAGEHFTPREVIRLMVELLEIPIPTKHLSIYDPACGTGGMLSVAKEHLLDRAATEVEKARVEKLVTVHGQELSPTNYAICKADLLIKNDQQATVFPGNSLIPHDPRSPEAGDQLAEPKNRFDFMLSNPPFGVTWGGKDGYEKEARKLEKTRYQAGMPRVNDGALLFLETMLAKMQPKEKGGSRIAIIFNGSPLSNGDCGSGESEIRRWILENDWLDAIVMLPDQLFYNTGIFTYIWLLRNEKPTGHRGKVMIIDARKQFEKEPKSFGNKRNRMTQAHHQWVSEHAINELKEGEQIEDRFEGDDYRLIVVANKFQTGFDQPLLAGMFIDKAVVDRNAVQTVSRLNRSHEGKKDVVVVDFTNNARAILKAFVKYRKGTPFEPVEPDQKQCVDLYKKILKAKVFTQDDATALVKLVAANDDPQVQFTVNGLRTRFQKAITDIDERKEFVYLLARFVKSFHFLTSFFTYPRPIAEFAAFAEYVGPQLIKAGGVSELMKLIRQTDVVKAAVQYQGEVKGAGTIKVKSGKGMKGAGPPPKKVSIQDMITEIKAKFDISDEEALYIREVTEEKTKDPGIQATVSAHREDRFYLDGPYRIQVNGEIQSAYAERGRYDELAEPKYTDPGAIFDIMAVTVIDQNLRTSQLQQPTG